jgi:hypothetical protein
MRMAPSSKTETNTDTQKLELSDDELGCEQLDAVGGGACDLSDFVAAGTNPLVRVWVQQGCPVPKSK